MDLLATEDAEFLGWEGMDVYQDRCLTERIAQDSAAQA